MVVQRGENVPEHTQEQETEPEVQHNDEVQHDDELNEEQNHELVNPLNEGPHQEIVNPQHEDPPVDAQHQVRQSRSGRLIRKPARYLLLGESNQDVIIDEDGDPTSYDEALGDVDAQEWFEAMNREMDSMYSNSV